MWPVAGTGSSGVGFGRPRGGQTHGLVPIDPLAPDLVTSLHLDLSAARTARHCVRTVDSPSPDLRDAVTLLTSELVTRAVSPDHPSEEELCLRVWMPPDVVRVELSVPRDHFFAAEGKRTEDLGVMVLDRVADRWSIEPDERNVSLWFEIDRRPHGAGERREAAEAADFRRNGLSVGARAQAHR
jgi:hypothetical protein